MSMGIDEVNKYLMKGEDEDSDNFWRGHVKDEIEDHRFPGMKGRREDGKGTGRGRERGEGGGGRRGGRDYFDERGGRGHR
jgi:hypothetical protein